MFVYALQSERDKGIYIGMAADVERRVKEHNAGYNRSMRSRRPFRLFYGEECGSHAEAREREKFLKSGQGRDFLRSRVDQ
jgi:putative endonuclease